MKKLLFLLAFPVMVCFSGCSKDDVVEKVTVNPDEIRLNVGEEYRLGVRVPEEFSGYATAWLADNETIATVDGEGVIRAVAPGETYVTFISMLMCGTNAPESNPDTIGHCKVTVTE